MSDPSDGMVERVAAVFEQAMGSPASGRVVWTAESVAAMKEQARRAARAAIGAMREPTADQLQLACEKHTPGQPMPRYDQWSSEEECPRFQTRRKIWRSMIDAALGNGPLPPQPHDPPAADNASGMTEDQEIADLKRLLSLSKERLPTEKPRGPDTSGDGGDWRKHPECP